MRNLRENKDTQGLPTHLLRGNLHTLCLGLSLLGVDVPSLPLQSTSAPIEALVFTVNACPLLDRRWFPYLIYPKPETHAFWLSCNGYKKSKAQRCVDQVHTWASLGLQLLTPPLSDPPPTPKQVCSKGPHSPLEALICPHFTTTFDSPSLKF